MAQWLVNLPLTLWGYDGFHDRLFVTSTPKGTVTYIVHVNLYGQPLTPALLEAAQAHAAQSLDPVAQSARRELRKGKSW